MFNEEPYVIVIDRGGNLFKVKEKTMQKCFDKIIAPLDIINQIGNESEMEFDTAWSCPVNIFKELSRQFSGVEIVVEFADEDIGSNCGKITFLNGEIEEYIDMDGNQDFALELWGYDKDEYYQEMEEE